MTQRFGLPRRVWTDDPDDQFGYSRLRVDAGQTSFFKVREFRIFNEFSVAAGNSKVYKFVTSVGSGHHHESATDSRPYGVPAGTYYVKVTSLSGTSVGAVNIRWEERP